MNLIGQPSQAEIDCLARLAIWEDTLKMIAENQDDSPEMVDDLITGGASVLLAPLAVQSVGARKRPRPEYDWRVVVQNGRRVCR